ENTSIVRVSDSRPSIPNMAQAVDYDNDGMLDILSLNANHLAIERNAGLLQKPAVALLDSVFSPSDLRSIATGDLNADGAVDLLAVDDKGSLVALKNESASKNYVAVNLAGKSS